MLARTAFSLLSPGGRGARLSILIFHRVLAQRDPLFPAEPDARRFDELMGWVARWFNVLPLDEAVARLRSGELPPRAAVITFDDGYADNCTVAMPILQRHGLSATFFIAAGFLDGGRMWNDTLIEAVRNARVEWLETGLQGIGGLRLCGIGEQRAAIDRLIKAVKHLPPAARSDAVARIAEASAADLPDDLMLSTSQLRALRAGGMLIGGHTLTHPILAASTDTEAEREIGDGKARLEALLGEPVRLFAYPNGKPGADYERRHVDMVRALGFDAAVSTCWGVNDGATDIFQLRRFTPWDRQRWRFALRLLDNLRRTPGALCR
ncbi:polysaccharide deacetylase family protein [Pseudothauera lacus]|uniref:Carbohydrate esterase family protein n=1 Tax=Pseudothauera lacus TaxID=2136175 RepID=A0A2T4IG75_9RHOO|nr:polysaccharide deacetylase family protein [Pseudothauera lacus]PTD96768.1 carbohydrate esterase family protein [Pseudothauera lacus]